MKLRPYDFWFPSRTQPRCLQVQPLFSLTQPRLRPAVHHRVGYAGHHARGLKKVAKSVSIDTTIQGPLAKAGDDGPVENEEPIYPTVMQQALNNMRKFSHCVLLTRVGSFYEVHI
jgi:hypothetical protein